MKMKYTGDYGSKAHDQSLKEIHDIETVTDLFSSVLIVFVLESTVVN